MNDLYKQAISYCFLYILLTSTAFAQISVKTDKNSLSTNDTLTLMLEIPGADRPLPDLSPLARDFRISSSQRSSIFRHTSGSREASTRWQINLHPLRSGTLTIPVLRANEHLSEPLQIMVSGSFNNSALSNQGTNALSPPPPPARNALFFTVELDRERVYQGAQLLYRASLYHLEPLPESTRLLPPQISNGTTREVGPQRKYTDTLDQQSYNVTEQFYALFPQEPGFIEIQGAALQTGEDNSGSLIFTRADDLEVEVLPIADESAYWLPAEQVTLSQDLIQSDYLPGSLLLNISLSATALGSEQLPRSLHTQAPVEGAKLLSRQHDDSEHAMLGLTGNLRESWLITPAHSGIFTIPVLDLQWWNTLEERTQSASTPATSIEVLVPAPFTAQTVEQQATQTQSNFPTGLIIFLSAISLLASLGCFYSYFYYRQRGQNLSQQPKQTPSVERHTIKPPSEQRKDDEQEAFDVLAAACLANDAQLSSRALLIWAPRFWPNAIIQDLESVGQAAEHQTLSFLILDLEHHLYSEDIDLWQGDLLLEAIKALRQRQRQRRSEEEDMDIFDLSVHDAR